MAEHPKIPGCNQWFNLGFFLLLKQTNIQPPTQTKQKQKEKNGK